MSCAPSTVRVQVGAGSGHRGQPDKAISVHSEPLAHTSSTCAPKEGPAQNSLSPPPTTCCSSSHPAKVAPAQHTPGTMGPTPSPAPTNQPGWPQHSSPQELLSAPRNSCHTPVQLQPYHQGIPSAKHPRILQPIPAAAPTVHWDGLSMECFRSPQSTQLHCLAKAALDHAYTSSSQPSQVALAQHGPGWPNPHLL